MPSLLSIILFGTVFASFIVASALSNGNVTVINNLGDMVVNWNVLGFTGQGDPTKPNTNFVRKCGDIKDLTKTNDLYYTIKMGIFVDYIFPNPTQGTIYKDTCIIIAGNSRSCDAFGKCQPFTYSPHDPTDVEKFKIEDVVVDVKYTPLIYGSSQKGITKDGRKSISAWGSHSDYLDVGGCCRATNDTEEEEWWWKPYTLYATPFNMNYLYLHTPKLSGAAPHFTINSKVTDINIRSDSSEINTVCTWEIKDLATNTSVNVTGCVLATDVTADNVIDKNYSVTVSIKPVTGKDSRLLWKTNSTVATAYIVVPGGVATTTTTLTSTTSTSTTTKLVPLTTTTGTTTKLVPLTTTTGTTTKLVPLTTNSKTSASAAPTQSTTPAISGSSTTTSTTIKQSFKNSRTSLIIVGCVIGALILIGLTSFSLFLFKKVAKAKKIAGLES